MRKNIILKIIIVLSCINLTGCNLTKLSVRDSDQYKYVTLTNDEAAMSELEAIKDTTEYLKKAFVANNAFGSLEKVAKPLVRPAEYIVAWRPPFCPPGNPNIMESGHYIYIKIKPEHFIIEEFRNPNFIPIDTERSTIKNLPKEVK